jgi:FdhD protein
MHAKSPACARTDQVTEWSDGNVRRMEDYLAAEEPLEIRIDGKPLTVTMRTPGNDEELAAGFLWTEGLIDSPGQIAEVRRLSPEGSPRDNIVSVELGTHSFDSEILQRNFFAASSCGICGKASITAIRVRGLTPPNAKFRIDPELLCEFPARLHDQQQLFGRTGGLHAAALFDSAGKLLIIREDIGRHNAVDKVIGWSLVKGLLPLSECAMMVSGRGGFEIVQKALAAGVPVLASVSAPSSLAVKLARETSLTLIGFLRDRRFVIYSNPERCLSLQSHTL